MKWNQVSIIVIQIHMQLDSNKYNKGTQHGMLCKPLIGNGIDILLRTKFGFWGKIPHFAAPLSSSLGLWMLMAIDAVLLLHLPQIFLLFLCA